MSPQLTNLSMVRIRKRKKIAVEPKFKDAYTSMDYDRTNTSAATNTKADVLRDKVAAAVELIESARQLKKVRTVSEKIMLIQFVFHFIHSRNCTLTTAVDESQRIFRWCRQEDIFKRFTTIVTVTTRHQPQQFRR